MKKINIVIVGCGEFAKCFVPLFKMHPTVEQVRVCDIDKNKEKEYCKMFGVESVASFEAAIEDESVNAIAIFTQRHTHGDLAVRALDGGKNVYSAVPMAITVEDCKNIIDAVKRSGKTYMMGETCVYYPGSMYCAKAYRNGEFGNFVYGESQYFHDLSHFSKAFVEDRRSSAVPPFFYPTHSTAMILNAANAYALKVSAVGY